MTSARDLAGLVKLSHSVFALPFALLSLLAATAWGASAAALLIGLSACGGGGDGGGESNGNGNSDGDGDGNNNKNQTTINLLRQQKKR